MIGKGMTFMKTQNIVRALSILCALSLASPITAQEGEKKAEGEKGEKAKADKVSGDIGLLDTEKNYLIVVTKDGKLVTVDFDQKTKVTELKAKDAKMADIGLGSSATVQYTKKGEKNYVSGIEFTPAKGGD
jgi:major membrane immunogen (membrane-anchored lipoprotein)